MRRRELTPILLMAAAVSAGCGQSGPYGTLPGAATGPEFVRLQGGTDVEFDRPEGWTDVVVKLVPQLSTPGGEDLPAAERQAFSFRTVILVEVVKEGRTGEFALRRVGVGLSQPVNGRDTVVTMGSREKLGVALTKESKFALNAAEERLHQSRLIAGTSTF
ncbi:MAG TPA: hypothetical protein VGH33_02920, partial [Isosphaeraceae bacterium]